MATPAEFCRTCHGRGRTATDATCPVCDGVGMLHHDRTVDLRTPAPQPSRLADLMGLS